MEGRGDGRGEIADELRATTFFGERERSNDGNDT